jgi:hypothetical protein
MGKLEELAAYIATWMPHYNRLMAQATEFGSVEKPATIRPVARMWFEAGIPAEEAVRWFGAGVSPADALRLRQVEQAPTSYPYERPSGIHRFEIGDGS